MFINNTSSIVLSTQSCSCFIQAQNVLIVTILIRIRPKTVCRTHLMPLDTPCAPNQERAWHLVPLRIPNNLTAIRYFLCDSRCSSNCLPIPALDIQIGIREANIPASSSSLRQLDERPTLHHIIPRDS